MRRVARSARRTAAGTRHFCVSRLLLVISRETASPDRTHMEIVQDRQNAFSWSAKHIFRPHQRFTYDPTSWSRVLEEKVKKERKLSLSERLRIAQDHEAERDANRRAMDEAAAAGSAGVAEDGALPDYFFDGAASPAAKTAVRSAWGDVSLQEMLDDVEEQHALLTAPRYQRNSSLARQRGVRRSLRDTLVHLLERLETAVVGETVTADAMAYAWFVLLRNAEDLLVALAEARDYTEEQAIRHVYSVLSTQLSALLDRTLTAGNATLQEGEEPQLSLEALIELYAIMTHPFTRHAMQAFEGSGAALSRERWERRQLPALFGLTWASLGERLRSLETPRSEWADPTHAAALCTAVAVTHPVLLATTTTRANVAPSQIVQRLALALTGQARCLHLLLAGGLDAAAGATRARVRQALTGGRPEFLGRQTTDGEEGEPHLTKLAALKPRELDPSQRPGAVLTPPTEPWDVPQLTRAAADLLRCAAALSASERQAARAQLQALADALLLLYAHTPNYDLDVGSIARVSAALIELELLSGAPSRASVPADSANRSTALQQHLRALLVLSRLDYSAATGDRPAAVAPLCRLVRALCALRPPAPIEWCAADADVDRPPHSDSHYADGMEWRRLRGIAVSKLLSVVSADELAAADETLSATDGGGRGLSWVEVLAFGPFDGAVPLHTWVRACEIYVQGRAEPSPSVADALVALRCRILARPPGSPQHAPLSESCVRLLARCVDVVTAAGGASGSRDRLYPPFSAAPDEARAAWEDAACECTLPPDNLALLLQHIRAMTSAAKHESSKVITF